MNTPLSLDFQRSTAPPGLGRTLLFVAGFASLLVAASYQAWLSREIAYREHELDAIKREARPRMGSRRAVNPRQLAEEIDRAKTVIQQLTLPWDRMFASIESSDSKGIALLTVQPDAEKRRISIGGEARNLASMLEYVRALERSGTLNHVHVTGHEIQQRDPQRTVRFVLEAAWAVKP